MIRWMRWLAVQLGYWLRPYDPVLDARRWRWSPDGHQRQAAVEAQIRAAIRDAGMRGESFGFRSKDRRDNDR